MQTVSQSNRLYTVVLPAKVQSEPLANRERAERMVDMLTSAEKAGWRTQMRLRWQLATWFVVNHLYPATRRSAELFAAGMALMLLWPLIALVALAVKLDSPGPILFRQKRVGKGGQLFDCLKFRSMYIDAEARKAELMAQNEAGDVVFKMRHDPRVTRVGRFIRKASLDELPQLFNVLRGEMSLVGPRPSLPSECEKYQVEFLRRMDVTPGITGLQQVSGRSDLDFDRWVELDLQYVDERSLTKDVVILVKTIPAVLTGRGAY